MLPPIVHIQKEADKAALRWSIERMMQELREPQPGSFLVLQHLAHMMLVQALRLHLAEGLNGRRRLALRPGGRADRRRRSTPCTTSPRIPGPCRSWRSASGCRGRAFAAKFKETVGATPIDYLTRWRMLLAGDRLTNSGDPISVISMSLGYESESAFSTAFKRVMGCSPRQYGRGRTLIGASH